jgi:hypothetical protein
MPSAIESETDTIATVIAGLMFSAVGCFISCCMVVRLLAQNWIRMSPANSSGHYKAKGPGNTVGSPFRLLLRRRMILVHWRQVD